MRSIPGTMGYKPSTACSLYTEADALTMLIKLPEPHGEQKTSCTYTATM